MRVPMNVTSRTRTGIAYQRGGRGVCRMLSGYTIRQFTVLWERNQDSDLELSLRKFPCGFGCRKTLRNSTKQDADQEILSSILLTTSAKPASIARIRR
jgi:hypothetical protein